MYQQQRIEEAVPALLGAFQFDRGRAWKRYDFAVMEDVCEQGYVSDPRGKAVPVYLTPEGQMRAQQLVRELFGG